MCTTESASSSDEQQVRITNYTFFDSKSRSKLPHQ